jgi:general secretion pathway protein N
LRVYWRLALAGAAAYLIILVVTVPAERVVTVLERRLSGLHLQGVSGTLLSGTAQRLSIEGLAIGPLSWSLRPLPLLLARLEYRFTVEDPVLRGGGLVDIGLGSVYLHHLNMEMQPGPLVTHFSPVPVQTSGLVSVRIETVELTDGFPRELSGHLDWADAQVVEPVALSLGHVEAALQSETDTLVSHVSGSGETALAGDLSLTREGDYTLDLLVTPGPSASADLVEGLRSIGQARPGGAYLITDSGKL